ncbi:MAG: HDOD domain-containing protein [Desulfatitalea sp.]
MRTNKLTQRMSSNVRQEYRGEISSAADMMRYLETIQELPTLSAVAMRVNGMLQDMNTTARELSEVIEKDQSMVSKLLRLANSSFFGFSSRVSNVAHAVMILGFNSVLNAVLSMAVMDALALPKNKQNKIDMTAFWQHSISVAVVSRHLRQASGGHRHENAFTAGIIHDIGKVVMARYFPERFGRVCQAMEAGKSSFQEAEKNHFPMGHGAVGAFLVRCWNLPDDLSAVVAQHHQPEIMSQANDLVLVVHAADAIVNRHLENREPSEGWPLCNTAKTLLGEQIDAVEQWLPSATEEIQAACQAILE